MEAQGNTQNGFNLTGQLLIAMPDMRDPRFAQSVVLICEHSDSGAIGLIINKPSDSLSLGDLFQRLSIPHKEGAGNKELHFGGPVEGARGFVLHSSEYQAEPATLLVHKDIAMTTSVEILQHMASGRGPEKSLVLLGYAGWAAGQLEEEIAHNGWLCCESTAGMVFDLDDGAKWRAALESLGVDALMLSSHAGQA